MTGGDLFVPKKTNTGVGPDGGVFRREHRIEFNRSGYQHSIYRIAVDVREGSRSDAFATHQSHACVSRRITS